MTMKGAVLTGRGKYFFACFLTARRKNAVVTEPETAEGSHSNGGVAAFLIRADRGQHWEIHRGAIKRRASG